VEVLAAQGVLEVTLLGQNVNSYGRSFGDRSAFAALLRAVGAVDGIERVRFTSPHPRDFTDDVIAAMAETPAVCPSLHMPLQSGSDAVLKAMRRSYRSERFLGILDRSARRCPTRPITTDVIVGLPRRDRRRLRGHPAGGRGVPLRRRLHLPVQPPARHPRRRAAGAAQGRR
jgi:tRNA-2-methylthio-N6-dimethylallyladenosine synthase